MNLITTPYPDVWYGETDIHTNTKVVLRKESITCCGLSGGDFIHCMNTPRDLIAFLSALTPQAPCASQNKISTDLPKLQEKWFTAISQCYTDEKGWVSDPRPIIAEMTSEIWFTHGQPLIRFSLIVEGTVCDLLTHHILAKRLHAVLTWWSVHEATAEEQKKVGSPSEKTLQEMGKESIARAINLYNHGTYELTGLDAYIPSSARRA
jgi:hypothetical protein